MTNNIFPVFLFTGFLESGKTKFIQETLEDKRFNSGEKTLVILCEEGIEEYNPDKFSGENVFIKVVDSEKDLSVELLKKYADETGAERAVVEYNGMWMLDNLYKALPDSWAVVQEMMFVDAKTFLNFNQNMRSLVVDKLQSVEFLVFNRADETTDMMEFHKIVRGVNTRVNMAYEYTDGRVEYDEIEDPLPFDIEADVVEIKDDDYAVWYRDMNEHVERYDGKTLFFKAMLGLDKALPKNNFLAGRHIMTCCADDIEFFPVICKGKISSNFKNGDWIMVKGKLSLEFHKVYGGKGPVIKDLQITLADEPENKVATFS